MIVGAQTRDQFLQTRVRSYRCYTYLERITGEEETIVMLYENKGYYLDRPFLADGMYETSYFVNKAVELGNAERFAQWLEESDIKYIIVNQYIRTETVRAAREGTIFKNPELDEHYLIGVEIIERFIGTYLNRDFSDYGSTVYMLAYPGT